MSDASKAIAQQFAQAGVVPGDLVPAGGVAKIYVDQQDAILQTNINNVAGVAASAQQTAAAATTASGQAVVAANAAKGAAEGAATSASTAQSAAATAKQAADAAQDAADAAQERADAAYALAEEGGGVSGPGYGKINGVQAVAPNDSITFAAGTGMAVSTDPETKTVTYTAQGSAAPGAHAGTHITGGSDVIPNAAAGGNSGLMSGSDKTKLNGIATGANNYTHPATHPPSIIAQDVGNRFVTDTEKAIWNAKASQLDLTAHTGDTAIHVTQADKDKWNAGTGGGGGGTTAAITYYVDGVAGLDTNDGLTQGTALKTPQVAIDKLYDLSGGHLKHACTIRIKGAQTYAGNLFVLGFFGKGSLTITRWAAEAQSVLAGNLIFQAVSVFELLVSYISPQVTMSFRGCSYASASNISMTNTTAVAGIEASNGTTLQVANCMISNRSNAILASNARIYSASNSGTGNSVGLSATSAGVIGKGGTQPAGTTLESTQLGGVIR